MLTNIIRTSNIVTKQYKVLTLKSTWIQEELEDLRRKWNYTLLYIEIHMENSGHNVIEYQQLKSFIVQVVAISLCKLWIFTLTFSKKAVYFKAFALTIIFALGKIKR